MIVIAADQALLAGEARQIPIVISEREIAQVIDEIAGRDPLVPARDQRFVHVGQAGKRAACKLDHPRMPEVGVGGEPFSHGWLHSLAKSSVNATKAFATNHLLRLSGNGNSRIASRPRTAAPGGGAMLRALATPTRPADSLLFAGAGCGMGHYTTNTGRCRVGGALRAFMPVFDGLWGSD